MTNNLIIKLGGALLNNNDALTNLFSALAAYHDLYHRPIIIVHGGGCLVDDMMKKLKLPVEKKNGLRCTTLESIDIITGVLSGTANKKLLAWTKKYNINAIGLCLGDGELACVSQLHKKLGYVGKVNSGNPRLLYSLLKLDYMIIISSIGITDHGMLMNVNADQACVMLAKILNADLLFLSDVSGVLDGKGRLINTITTIQANELIKKGIIVGGMIIKVNAAIEAACILQRKVIIAGWHHKKELFNLFNGIPVGTQVIV